MIHTTRRDPDENCEPDAAGGAAAEGGEVALPTLALVRDLLFSSKLTAAAKASGGAVKVVRDPAKLETLDGKRLIVDLNTPGHVEAAAAWKTRTGGEVIGFIAHVAGDGIAEAKRLRLDRVISNGGFAGNVDRLI